MISKIISKMISKMISKNILIYKYNIDNDKNTKAA